ncbi:hypothetical protein, partial [Klebsiella variicola]|uniref:hypothetical protein n=1 Tax=Klebsiella variicola TaxID=244366 RepID=UPI0039C18B97
NIRPVLDLADRVGMPSWFAPSPNFQEMGPESMFFASDNWAGAHPKVAAALNAHTTGFAAAYGDSDLDTAVAQRFSEIFEREVAI